MQLGTSVLVKSMKVICAVLACLYVTACASSSATGQRSARRELQWPPLPLEPRIEWVKDINDYRDAGISKGFWQRLADLVFGEDKTRIIKPYGVFCDEKERLFVVDVGASVVHVMDMRNKEYFLIGKEDKAVFRTPIAITEDEQENVYITDSSAGAIYRYSLIRKELSPFVPFKLGRPTGIAYNRRNKLIYVADTTAHQVIAFGLDGMERMRIGARGDAPGQFNYPTDLFVDAQGSLLVTDSLNFRIQRFSPDGQLLDVFGRAGDSSGSFAKPKGVAADSEGHIYVCDALFDAVQIFDGTGRVLLDFGSNGGQEGQFWMPSGIYIDGKDYIYVADTYNRRVQVFRFLKLGDAMVRGAKK